MSDKNTEYCEVAVALVGADVFLSNSVAFFFLNKRNKM